LCFIITAADDCVKVENEEFIQLSNDYNFCDGTNNKVSFSQTDNEFPRTSEMAESCHVKKILPSDSVEPNRHDIVVNKRHFTGPSTSQDSDGTEMRESTIGKVPHLNSDNVEPNNNATVVTNLIGHGTSQGSSGHTHDEILEVSHSVCQGSYGTEIKENTVGEVRQLASDTVEPNKHATVVNNRDLIGPGTSQGSTGTGTMSRESTLGEIEEMSCSAVDDGKFQCKECGLKLKCEKYLRRHMVIHTGEKPYKCSFCDKKFLSKYYSKRHELGHKGELPQCRVCGGRYRNLQAHMLTHDDSADKNKHVCSVCKKGFRIACNLKSHMLIHSGEKPHTCQVCGFTFTIKQNLKKHMRIHTGEKPYKCSFCDKKFRTKYEHKMHELWHKGELPQCPVCGGRYQVLKVHMLTHDDSADKNRHVCSVCKKGFRIVGNLKAHMLIHSGEKPYTCQDCGGRFRTSTHLKIHMKTHTKEKNHVCSVCESSFSLKGSLNSHMRTHSDERPYRCEACGKAFKQNGALKKHQLTHQLTKTSEKHFICDTCGKQFRLYTTLQIHSLIHSGVQPYECSVCGMKFNQSGSMQRHKLIHTGEKPYSCSDCGERFRQSSLLAYHRRRHCAKNEQK